MVANTKKDSDLSGKLRRCFGIAAAFCFLYFSSSTFAAGESACQKLLGYLQSGQLQKFIDDRMHLMLGKNEREMAKMKPTSPEVIELAKLTLSRDPADQWLQMVLQNKKDYLELEKLKSEDGKRLRVEMRKSETVRREIANDWVIQAQPKFLSVLDKALEAMVKESARGPQLPKDMALKDSNFDDLVVITHQSEKLQNDTAAILRENKMLKNAPRIALVSPDFRISSDAFLEQLSTARYSAIGKFAEMPRAKRLHVMGGNLGECLSATVNSAVERFLLQKEGQGSNELQIYLYSDVIYTGNKGGPGTLRELMQRDPEMVQDILSPAEWAGAAYKELGLKPLKMNPPGDFMFIQQETGKIIHFHIL